MLSSSLIFASLLLAQTADVDWPTHYPVQLLDQIQARDHDGRHVEFARGFLFHRDDVEEISLDSRALSRCEADRDTCNAKLAEETAVPAFWDSTLGDVTKIAIGFVAGVSVTLGVLHLSNAMK